MILKYTYKGYRTEFQYDSEDKIYYGFLLNAKKGDSISFHADTLLEGIIGFKATVDEYIELRKNLDLNKGVTK